jgi:predicted ATPase/DNA-binding winged helix-turn-helix (wHTH) protein
MLLKEVGVPDPTMISGKQAIWFGPFRLLPAQRLILEADKPLRIGSRALEILIALVERAGELVSKEELIARAWPNTFVAEGNLRVNIAALRRLLGDGQAGNRYVANIPGRGYRFVAPISLSAEQDFRGPPASIAAPHDLPAPLTRMLGRDDIVNSLISQLPQRRLITLVGPGGIGKTTVALAVADKSAASYRDGVRFVDLAPLTDPLLVPSALAFVLGLAIRSNNPIPGLVAFLHDKDMLLVLDSCEHVIDAAASLAEQVLRGAPGVHMLATSREALRAQGERVQRLGPLGVPAVSAGLTAAEAMTYPAVQLFVERATESLDTFELTDADAPVVADVCRRLDGIALAIELAAGRVDAFGVGGLAAHLDDRFRLLMRGRRTALPRHQTLSATLDWSYEALPEQECVILRRLGVFAGAFTIEAAAAIAADPEATASNIIEPVANLVAKSLVVAEVGDVDVRYRLLDTTRAYARQKLNDSNEMGTFARRHAEFYLKLFERAEIERQKNPATEWLAAYGYQIDNLRSALDWAFSPRGDVALGAALTLAAVPLWFQRSLINECRENVERALAALDPDPRCDEHRNMRLYAALGWSLMYTTGRERPTGAAWQTALELAERLDDVDYQLRAVWGLWASRYNNGEYREALALAERFSALAANSADPNDPHVGDRMMGVVLHFLGDQTGARKHIERMLSRYVTPVHGSDIVRFQFEQRVTARITLARVLWLQGFADQALRVVESNIEEALAIGHALSLCNALANAACPVALLAGDLTAAERYTAMLRSQTERHALDSWHAYADIFSGELLVRRGHLDSGLTLLDAAIGKLGDARFAQYQTAFLGLLAENLAHAGRFDEGGAAINEALLQCGRTEERWCMSELLRIKGKIALLAKTTDAAVVAENEFLESLGWAHRQQALSWELRTAMSLACLWRCQGRLDDARNQLASVYGRFTEGFGTVDLHAAKQLLDELAHDTSRPD